MDKHQPLPSDGQLVVAVRDGVAEAWAELELRHGRIALAVGRKLYGRHGKSRTRIGLDTLRAEVMHGTGVVADDQNRALRAFRARSVAAVTDGGFIDPASPPDDELQALASSFASLPEPWQAALWHHHVDLEPSSGFIDVVGRTPENTDLLIGRAADDLLAAFVDELQLAGIELSEAERRDRRARIGTMLPDALVPRVAAMSVLDYRLAIGVESPVGVAEPAAEVAPPVPPVATVPPAPVIPVEVDEVVAEPEIDITREVPVVKPVGAPERLVLPAADHTGLQIPADGESRVLVAKHRKRHLILALLVGVVAVVLLGVAIAAIDTLRDDTATPTDGSAAVDLDGGDRQASENVFGMQFTVGESGADLGADVDVSIEVPGPIFESSRGTVRALVVNKGAAVVASTLTITPPDGITVDRVVGATCTGLSASASVPAGCDLAIPPGDTVAVDVSFGLTAPAAGRFVLDTNVAGDPIDVAIEPVRELRYGAVGRGDVLMIGNSVLSCDETTPSCAAVRDGTEDNVSRTDLPAAFVGDAPEFGVANSAAATLELDEASVAAAFLFWSGDLGTGDSVISSEDPIGNVTFAPPNDGPVEIIEAAEVRMSESTATHYIAYADVTESVAGAGSGSYLVGNVQSVEVGGSHAGWALVVVTDDDSTPLRQLMVLSPFDSVDDVTISTSLLPTQNLRQAPTVLRLLSFDADRGSSGDELVVNGTALSAADDDLFNSNIIGPRLPQYVNNFGTGIGIYRFDLDAPDELVAVNAASSDDEFLVGVIAMTIDLE